LEPRTPTTHAEQPSAATRPARAGERREKVIDSRAATVTGGAVVGGCCLIVAVAHFLMPTYGVAFLELLDAIYVGSITEPTVVAVVTLTLQAAADGAIAGFLVAWLYNRLVRARP
jgi:hypothetical protein